MPVIRQWAHRFAVWFAVLAFLAMGQGSFAQNILGIDPNIKATLVAERSALPGKQLTIAIHFEPDSDDWHGYWKNPGDAGYGMQLDWQLPAGWEAGEPQYPIPKRLLISDLMNHIYEGPYAVLIPITVPADARTDSVVEIGVSAQWLACTDKICVPERGELQISVPVGGGDAVNERFAEWRAAIPPMIDSQASFGLDQDILRIGIPLPDAVPIGSPHIYVANTDLVQYAAIQTYMRGDDLLIAEIPLADPDATLDEVEGILAFGGGDGVQFTAVRGEVPGTDSSFTKLAGAAPAFFLLLLGALAGGLILNIMPCVFPILSLKALSLARAGGSQAEARKEGLAYTAGVVLACAALGAVMLALRAAGEQVGWAFQLQEPVVVAALFVLAVAITANLVGLFELPSFSITRSGEPASAFATGLLAAIAATPCTGPFMAAALGAALLLPTAQALLLFAALGLGLALPFLLIGFVPALRGILPKPGGWMETFRKIMAVPMGLTALALIWLLSQLGGWFFALQVVGVAIGLLMVVLAFWGIRKNIRMNRQVFAIIFAGIASLCAVQAYRSYDPLSISAAKSVLEARPYSAETLAEARASGQPVFVWFTAHWCVTCKLNEEVAIEREATRAAFEEAGVIAVRGDWSLPDPAITEFLTKQGVAGIPLYVWYAPGEEGQQLPQLLTPSSLIELAKGSVQASVEEPAEVSAEQTSDTPQ